MRRINNFSGGAGSWAAAKRCAERHGTESMTLLFCDTFMEDNDLYRVLVHSAANVFGLPCPAWLESEIAEIPEYEESQHREKRWSCLKALAKKAVEYIPQLTWISDGRTPWEVYRDERFIGNSHRDPCSKILKRQLMDKWHWDHCDPSATEIYIGIDWSEIHRLDGRDGKPGIRERLKPWTVVAPMCDRPCLTKSGMLHWMTTEGIEPARLYKMGFPHNNCGGFCCKMGIAHAAHLHKVLPKRFACHEAEEKAMHRHLGRDDVAVLNDRRGGQRKPMTLEMLRQRIESGEEFKELEWGGCGCAL